MDNQMPQSWEGIAFNQVPDSSNQIHSDQVAKVYGFKGGLVPGVTVSAYLIHPAVKAWGLDWVRNGWAHAKVNSPLYDGEPFTVEVTEASADRYKAQLIRSEGTVSAVAEVGFPREPVTPPVRRHDPYLSKEYQTPQAIRENMEVLREKGCRAYKARWDKDHEMMAYLRDQKEMPRLLQNRETSDLTSGLANMAFLLGGSNRTLAGNAIMNPWIHLETKSQNFAAVPLNTDLVGEMQVMDLFDKKGHEFVDAQINIFNEATDECVCAIELRAIYRLRGL